MRKGVLIRSKNGYGIPGRLFRELIDPVITRLQNLAFDASRF